MEKNQPERGRVERKIQEEQANRLRDTMLTGLADVLPLEAYSVEQPSKQSAPEA